MDVEKKTMLRKSLLVALAVVAANSYAQESASKFSFKAPAGSVQNVFEALSKAAGARLSASGLVANDVIVLNLSDVTLADTMAHIASTLHAEWRQEATGYVLYRGANLESIDRRNETAARVAEFRGNLKRTLDEQAKMGAFNEATAKKLVDMQKKMEEQMTQSAGGTIRLSGDFNQVSRQTPAARAITALLSRMTDAQVASLTSGNRTVFSMNPTRMQLPMPGGSNQILKQFVNDALTYRQVTRRNEPPQGAESNRRIVINGFGAEGGGDGDPNLGIGYALLINQPGNIGPNTSVTLTVADTNGRTLASGQFFLGLGTQPPSRATTPPAEEKPIEMSDLAKELARVLNLVSGGGGGSGGVRMMTVAVGLNTGGTFTFSGSGDGRTPPMSAELKERILNPEKFDPLSFAPGEAFTGTADAKGYDLVAYLPDASFSVLNQIAGGGTITPTAFLATAKSQANLDTVIKDGWLLVSPKGPSTARDRRVNRSALGSALRQMDGKGYLSLDDWASFSTKQAKAPRFGEFDDIYFRLINGPAADAGLGQFSFGGGWQTLQFYASLSTAQKQAMTQNGRVPLGNLSKLQMDLLTEQVFNSFEGPNVVNRQQQGQPGRAVAFSFGGDVTTERTYLLPNGIPRNGFLTLTLRNNEVAQAFSSQGTGGKFLNAEGLAFERLRTERPELVNLGPTTQLDQFRMASQRTIGFLFTLTPTVSLSRQLEDNSPGNRPLTGFDQLPANFRQRVEAALEQLKRNWGTGGGGQIPPP